jgi:hypothetical protein
MLFIPRMDNKDTPAFTLVNAQKLFNKIQQLLKILQLKFLANLMLGTEHL